MSKPAIRIFKDTIHGLKAAAKNKLTAWMLIRDKCHSMGIKPPTIDNIIELTLILND